jgi:uncharacterized protein YjbJ (UPF0337 family)
MGTDDKIDNKAEELKGKVKEGVGEVTDDRDLQTEGQADQAKGNLKQAGEKIKDASSPNLQATGRAETRAIRASRLAVTRPVIGPDQGEIVQRGRQSRRVICSVDPVGHFVVSVGQHGEYPVRRGADHSGGGVSPTHRGRARSARRLRASRTSWSRSGPAVRLR